MRESFNHIKSDSQGLTIASPKEGILEIHTNELEAEFADGIDILVMEKTINTPEQKFGPNWFTPALARYKGVLLKSWSHHLLYSYLAWQIHF